MDYLRRLLQMTASIIVVCAVVNAVLAAEPSRPVFIAVTAAGVLVMACGCAGWLD